MRARLKLTPGQETELNGILDDTRLRYRELHERFRPEMKAIQDEQTDKVNAILDPAQQTEYGKMRDEREQRRKKDRDRTKYGL
jgi:hypothetical protein